MKLFTATLATLLIASPAMARPTSKQLSTAKDHTNAVLTAYKQGNKSKACNLYIKAVDYREQQGITKMWPVTPGGSAKLNDLEHKQNELTAELNQSTNKLGKSLCGSRWVYRNLITSYTRASSNTGNTIRTSTGGSVTNNIRSRCEKKWGTDYEMVAYCVKNQTEAARSLGY